MAFTHAGGSRTRYVGVIGHPDNKHRPCRQSSRLRCCSAGVAAQPLLCGFCFCWQRGGPTYEDAEVQTLDSSTALPCLLRCDISVQEVSRCHRLSRAPPRAAARLQEVAGRVHVRAGVHGQPVQLRLVAYVAPRLGLAQRAKVSQARRLSKLDGAGVQAQRDVYHKWLSLHAYRVSCWLLQTADETASAKTKTVMHAHDSVHIVQKPAAATVC